MLRIRLQRIGRKNYNTFRIVVTEHTRAPKSGDYLERLGSYDPNKDQVILKEERIKHWISVGAKPTDTVYNILVKGGVIEGQLKNVLPKKTPIKKEQDEQDTNANDQAQLQEESGNEEQVQENQEQQDNKSEDNTENQSAQEQESAEEKKE